jgi:lysophospholipase L1-like esterase
VAAIALLSQPVTASALPGRKVVFPTAVPTFQATLPNWTTTWEQQATVARAAHPVVLFFGDSLTAFWLTNGIATWNADFVPLGVVANMGIPGDKTENMLYRIDRGQLAGISPKVTVILAGTNDLGYRPPEVAAGIESVVTAVKSHLVGTRVLLEGVYPISAPGNQLHDEVVPLNILLKKWASHQARLRFINPGVLLVNKTGIFLPGVVGPDLEHPLAPGYAVIGPTILAAIQKQLR